MEDNNTLMKYDCSGSISFMQYMRLGFAWT